MVFSWLPHKNMKNKIIFALYYQLPLFLLCLLIYIQSDRAVSLSIPSFFSFPYMDKLVHFFIYGILGILFLRFFRTIPVKISRKRLIFWSIAAATCYGISDEIHQHFIPLRDADFLDFLADLAGSICGVFFVRNLEI